MFRLNPMTRALSDFSSVDAHLSDWIENFVLAGIAMWILLLKGAYRLVSNIENFNFFAVMAICRCYKLDSRVTMLIIVSGKI